MTLTRALIIVFVLLAAVVLAYPLFAPQPPAIDETQLVNPPAPIIAPSKPDDSPGQSSDDAGLPLPPPQPLPPTANVIEKPSCAGGVCPTPTDNGPVYRRALLRRRR
jgi:hypothetical protein